MRAVVYNTPIRTKLIGLLAGICLFALSAACAAFVLYDRASYAEAKRATLTVLLDAVAQSAKGPVAFGDGESATYVLNTVEPEASAEAAAIYAADGTRLATWHREGSGAAPPERLADVPETSGQQRGHLHLLRPIVQEPMPDAEGGSQELGHLYAVFSTADIDARTRSFLSIAAIVLLVSFVAAWSAASFGQRIITRPVTSLVEAVTRVQQTQDFSVRAAKMSGDELGLLTDSFNAMVGAIQSRDAELEEHRHALERRVAERTRDLDARNAEMRLVLDNVDQGFVTIDRDGVIQGERSEAFDHFFGPPEEGARLWEHLEHRADGVGLAMELGWESVTDGMLPLEMCLEQLPQRLLIDDRHHYRVEYRPIYEDSESFHHTLVIFTDISAEVSREREQIEQAETIAIFEGVASDRAGFMDFFDEANMIVQRLLADQSRELAFVMRDLHTLKGNLGVSRMHAMAAQVHQLEGRCLEAGEGPSPGDLEGLRRDWQRFCDRVETFVGKDDRALRISRGDFERLTDLVEQGASLELRDFLVYLAHEPLEPRLERLALEAKRLAKRVGVRDLRVVTEHNELRIPPGSGWLWSAVTHLVRNCVDHGLSRAPVAAPQVRLVATREGDMLVLEIADNGAGIDWDRVRALADKRGLPHATRAELTAVLWSDGFSTREVATEVSGRGVGMAAAHAAIVSHGGDLELLSEPGEGARFVARVPMSRMREAHVPSTPAAMSA